MMYDICPNLNCGWLIPLDRRLRRCPVCGERLRPGPVGVIFHRTGAVILAGLGGMSGALVGLGLAVLLVC